jgi:hypothetical protein
MTDDHQMDWHLSGYFLKDEPGQFGGLSREIGRKAEHEHNGIIAPGRQENSLHMGHKQQQHCGILTHSFRNKGG